MARRFVVIAVLAALLVVPAATAPQAATGSPEWVRTGGPLGGLGYDVRMRPDDPNVMFVTDAWAGVFRSEDAGATWHPVWTGITTRAGPWVTPSRSSA